MKGKIRAQCFPQHKHFPRQTQSAWADRKQKNTSEQWRHRRDAMLWRVKSYIYELLIIIRITGISVRTQLRNLKIQVRFLSRYLNNCTFAQRLNDNKKNYAKVDTNECSGGACVLITGGLQTHYISYIYTECICIFDLFWSLSYPTVRTNI